MAYSNEAKNRVLGISADTLEKYGAVSRETALEMAAGARKLTGADIALSSTGICGPASDASGAPVGLGYIALSSAEGVFCREIRMGSDRDRGRTVAAHHAFDMLIRYLSGTLR